MEKKKKMVLKAKPEKVKRSRRSIFADKKKRYLFMFLFMLPFIIAIAIFGTIAFRELKTIMAMASNSTPAETKPENVIESMEYILRDNPTDVQKEYFKQLKEAIEGEEPADEATVVSLVAQNYVTDFYTWTNKAGQYDIGGFCYIYDGEFENSDHYKDNVYQQARDGFYKYLSTYATKYGKENILEVTDVQVVSCQKMSDPYVINEHSAWKQDANEEWYDYRVDEPYEWYLVHCKWNYKETPLNLSQFANSVYLAIIKSNDRYVIVEAGDSPIKARTASGETETVSEGE